MNTPIDSATGATSAGGVGTEGREITPQQAESITNASCTKWTVEAYTRPAGLEFVLDVSGSMNDVVPGADGDSKWDVTRAALSEAIASLSPLVPVGMLLYPNKASNYSTTIQPVEECVAVDKLVKMAPLQGAMSPQRAALKRAMEVQPESYTPTHDAYLYALNEGLRRESTQTRRSMVLITDGTPTIALGCIGVGGPLEPSPTQPIVDAIKSARDEGIATFIIGLPGSAEDAMGNNLRPWLSDAAKAGGTESPSCSSSGPNYCHMDMSDSTDMSVELKVGLAQIAGRVIDGCTFELPEPPEGEIIDPNKSHLMVTRGDGTTVLLRADKEGECDEGWQFSTEGDAVLCPDRCKVFKLDPKAVLQISFGCNSQEIESLSKK